MLAPYNILWLRASEQFQLCSRRLNPVCLPQEGLELFTDGDFGV